MLTGYEETEREILSTLKIETKSLSITEKTLGTSSEIENAKRMRNLNCSIYSNRFLIRKAKSRFRTGVICIIAVSRIK